jgi:hypothetical protein
LGGDHPERVDARRIGDPVPEGEQQLRSSVGQVASGVMAKSSHERFGRAELGDQEATGRAQRQRVRGGWLA